MRFIEISIGGAPSQPGGGGSRLILPSLAELDAPIRHGRRFVTRLSCFLRPFAGSPIGPAGGRGSAPRPPPCARLPPWRGRRKSGFLGFDFPRRSGGGYIGGIPVGTEKSSPPRRIRPCP